MTTDQRPSVYPTLRYDDAPAAIRFLVEAFGITAESVHAEPDGRIAHAELSWGGGMIMISSRPRSASGPRAGSTSDGASDAGSLFDTGKSCVYLALDDPDAHHARAVAAGAEIVMGLTDQDYGSREYAARDAEGNIWCFGTYRPSPAGV